MAAVDFGGRAFLDLRTEISCERVGDFETELLEEFWRAFAFNAGMNLHIRQLAGKNGHHIIEGIFKAVARVLNKALEIDPEYIDEIPSTKGVL
jgi:imidazoleglycerol-phosphate dehydratase